MDAVHVDRTIEIFELVERTRGVVVAGRVARERRADDQRQRLRVL